MTCTYHHQPQELGSIEADIETHSSPAAMAITTAPSPKTTPSSSAWSRLVQLTKNASKTTHAHTAEPPKQPECHAPSATTPTVTPVRTIRLRHPIASPSRSDSVSQQHALPHYAEGMPSNPNRIQDDKQRATLDGAGSIEVCPCLVGDPPLPDGKCSLSSRQREREHKSPAFRPAKPVTLAAFWGTRAEGRVSTPKNPPNNVVVTTNIRSAGAETQERRNEESKHNTDNETDTYAPQRTGSTPALGDQRQNRSTESSNNTYVSSPLSYSNPVGPNLSPKTKAFPSTAGCSAARPSASTKQATQIHGDGAPLSCPNSAPLEIDASTSKSPLQEPSVAEMGPGAARKDSQSKGLQARKPTVTSTSDITRLDTPSSSQKSPGSPHSSSCSSSPSSSSSHGDELPAPTPTVEFKRKAKRRLTLHGAKYDDGCSSDGPLPPQKKAKFQATKKKKQTVQTTLSLAIGGSPGMRECKVCDTVYNPFHPEDVKVHAKRHAGALKLKAN